MHCFHICTLNYHSVILEREKNISLMALTLKQEKHSWYDSETTAPTCSFHLQGPDI